MLLGTARVVKNRDHGFGGMDSWVSMGYLCRQMLKVVRSSGLECRRSHRYVACELETAARLSHNPSRNPGTGPLLFVVLCAALCVQCMLRCARVLCQSVLMCVLCGLCLFAFPLIQGSKSSSESYKFNHQLPAFVALVATPVALRTSSCSLCFSLLLQGCSLPFFPNPALTSV